MANPTGKGGFKKGDPRINRKGRPKSFDAFRTLALQIAHEPAIKDNQPIVINGKIVTKAEAILRQWAQSRNAKLQQLFVEVAFGKVPTPVDLKHSGNLEIEYVNDWRSPEQD